jgi:regulatory protein spx
MYTSPGCCSCRKAKRWLQDNHIDFVEKNVFSNMLSETEIKYIFSRSEHGTSDLISSRSKYVKNLEKDIDDYSMKELIALIQQNPSILRRPIMLSETSMVVGYDEDEITTFVPRDAYYNARPVVGSDQPGSMYLSF